VVANGGKQKGKTFARLYVADEFRFENNGKMFVIGLYADGVVLFRVPRNAPPPSKEQPYGLDLLSLLVVVGGFTGEDTVRINFAQNKPFEQRVSLKPGGSVNLHIPMRPFTFATFGVKDLLVEVGGEKHELQLELRADYIDPVSDLSAFMSAVTRPVPTPLPRTPEDATIVANAGKPALKRRRPKSS